MIAFLKRPFWFGWPVYAWIGGGAALVIAGVIFYRNRGGASKSSNVTANVPTRNASSPIYPYPSASGASGGGVLGNPNPAQSSSTAPSPAAVGGVVPPNPSTLGMVPPAIMAPPNIPPWNPYAANGSQIPNTQPGGYTLITGTAPIANPTAVQTQGTVLGGVPSRLYGGINTRSGGPVGMPLQYQPPMQAPPNVPPFNPYGQ